MDCCTALAAMDCTAPDDPVGDPGYPMTALAFLKFPECSLPLNTCTPLLSMGFSVVGHLNFDVPGFAADDPVLDFIDVATARDAALSFGGLCCCWRLERLCMECRSGRNVGVPPPAASASAREARYQRLPMGIPVVESAVFRVIGFLVMPLL